MFGCECTALVQAIIDIEYPPNEAERERRRKAHERYEAERPLREIAEKIERMRWERIIYGCRY